MAYKQFTLPKVGDFTVYKRRGSSSLRLSITGTGEVRVSQPTWLPYSAGVAFAEGKAAWIHTHRPAQKALIKDGQAIGKAHYVRFVPTKGAASIKTRVTDDAVLILLPSGIPETDANAQAMANKAAERALKKEGERFLFHRLKALAVSYNFSYQSVGLKKLKGRWGSCSNKGHITLNIFLLELPWELIDYVLVHELIHTQHLNHSQAFWRTFEECLPGARQLQKKVHTYQPVVGAGQKP